MFSRESGDQSLSVFHRIGLALIFHYPNYGKVWIGNVISSLGDQVGWIALTWLLLHQTGSASAVGWVTLLYQLPSIVISPFAGLILDRYSRARIMSIGNFLLAFVFIIVAVISWNRNVDVWLIYGLIGVAGILLPFNTTGESTLLPDLIPKNKLPQANYLIQIEWQMALILGPAIGGFLIEFVDTHVLILVDAVSFIFSAIILFTLPQHAKNTELLVPPWKDLQDGIKYLTKNRPLLVLAVITLFFNLFYGPYEVILPFMAKSIFNNPSVLGIWWSIFAIGSIVGSLVFSAQECNSPLSRTLALIIVVWGIVTTVIAFSNSIWLTSIIMFVAGIDYSPWGAIVMTIQQKIIPSQLHGRVIGTTMSFTMMGMPIGAWLTGFLLEVTPSKTVFLICGICTITIGIFAFTSSNFKRLD